MTRQPPPDYIISYACDDVEEFCSAPCALRHDIKQLSPGKFSGRSTLIRLPGCTFERRIVAARHTAYCWLPEAATLVFPLDDREAYVRGRIYGANRQLGTVGNHDAFSVVPPELGHFLITIPLGALADYLSPAEAGHFYDALARIDSIDVDPQRRAETTAKVAQLFASIEHAPAPLTPDMLKERCRTLIHVLYDYVTFHSRHAGARLTNLERILERALRLMAANPERDFTLDELAHEAYASKRAVQYAFSSIVGMPPMRFQKLYRLDLVRKELRVASTPLKFARIIAKYAFSNPGRISREYAELFGERPPETLRAALSAKQS